LAATLADINQRVLLIDADMRRPRLHKLFNVPNDQGLSTLLKEHARILKRPKAPVISETSIRNLSLMTSGPATASASNLLYSERLAELLRAVRAEFDFVLIDTPPMLQLADARIIGPHCDAVVLVVRSGKTTRDSARLACQRFQQDGTLVLGTILNDWVPGVDGYGYNAKYYDKNLKYHDEA
jgi:receptor protein-tyrosine kinase